MSEEGEEFEHPRSSDCSIEFNANTFLVDAALIADLLRVPAARVPILMREGKLTSACERGIKEHEGEFRLTFFYRGIRARLSADTKGHILRKSVIDFGDRPIPDAARRRGA
jgi:Family of unknown function (DUF6522)